jgi:hypothetical protein
MGNGRVIGVTMVRNEVDIIERTLRHMRGQVDGLLVMDNGSTDGTQDVIADLHVAGYVDAWVVDDDPGYWQSERMSRLAEVAGSTGPAGAHFVDLGGRVAGALSAEWIVPFDADEAWVGPHGMTVSTYLQAQPSWTNVTYAAIMNHYATAVDPAGDNPHQTMGWRAAEPLPLAKVAFRYEDGAVIEQGNHGVRLPGGCDTDWAELEGGLIVHHYPYRSAEQMLAKTKQGAAAYAAAPDLPLNMGEHWRTHGKLIEQFGEGVMGDIFRQHYWYLSPTDSGLVFDPLSRSVTA